MLAITVKYGEPIFIGNDIIIFVKKHGGNQVRYYVKAPKDVEINRIQEVKKKYYENND